MTRGLPTTRAGVDTAILIGYVGWRVAVLAQIVPALSKGVADSPRPGWYLASIAIAFLASAASCGMSIRRSRAIGPVWSWCELGGAGLLLLTMPLVVAPDHRIGTWIGYQAGFAHGVMSMGCVILIGARRRPIAQVAAAIGLMTACFLLAELPDAPADRVGTILANALTYPMAGIVLGSVGRYMRRLAADADTARAYAARVAAEAAAAEERERNQLLLHDSAGIMRLLADGSESPALEAILRKQAAAESARIRRFLSDNQPGSQPGNAVAGDPAHVATRDSSHNPPGGPSGSGSAPGTSSVAHTILAAAAGFSDLPIDFVMDLGGTTPLSHDVGNALTGGIRALLYNIRQHAAARSVVIHTAYDAEAARWEISVRDDGRGFDIHCAEPGFGLVVQAGTALGEVGIEIDVDSAPGEGTVALLRGPAATPSIPTMAGQ